MEIIKPTQYLGVWMNYTEAHLMEYTRDSIATENTSPTFTHDDREEILN